MPPRGSRKAATSAVSQSPPRSPQGPGAHKRKIEDNHEPKSPLRRSKRVKSTEVLRNSPSPAKEKVVPRGRKSQSGQSQKGASKSNEDGLVLSVKEEVEEEVKVTVKAEIDQTGVTKHEEADDKTAVTGTVSKKRKTKKEKESEMVPLRARTQGLRMCVGAHVSAAKGVFNAINNSMHIGGNAFALFLKSQRKWDNPPLQDDHRDTFRRLCIENKYDAAKHILPHGSYLVNLAQEDKAKAKQAYDSFLDDLRRCEALGINLYNFHPGSANQSNFSDALSRLAKALTNALAATSTVTPVLETMCGHGTTIGGKLTEFRDLLAMIPQEYHDRIGICIDTCHSFAAGYDLASPEGFKAFMKEFEDVIGLQHLRALHLNDSKAPRGSKRDLHANIGTGFLGLRAFHNVMNEPRFEGLPMVLETPIDRPVSAISKGSAQKGGEDSDSTADTPKNKKKQPKRPASAKEPTVADPSVWAREIELLESLIGMDPESPEFRALEAQLAEEGREMREKQQEQYERKLDAEEKKKTKSPRKKGQKTLMEMMGGAGKKGKAKKASNDDSEDEGCQSHTE
ncbi:DNA (apurinic or apyrimidinic site) lyase [Aspergillus bombycis]|uniref:Apurinic-apyrimidinic endonuclease 1 n=1 Tax=Aspergillus bombycis TaxID=109264 RepID=A0A1F8AG93_9EURO|nr:DNA (apurinic or apyrimidinic site) lyase [Aspergillus bombycis]OGM50365.1 DNA (apurinic or apyrimidinic site) lyase [Aspergillus bombycis]